MKGEGYTDHEGPSLPRATVSAGEPDGVPTWHVPTLASTVCVEAKPDEGLVDLRAGGGLVSLAEDQVRGLITVLSAAWSKVEGQT